MGLNYIQADEDMWGGGGAQPDTLNRGLRSLLSDSGHDPDASPFPGIIPVFNINPYVAANAGNGQAGIAAAATAAGAKGIYFPAGTTTINSNITITVPVQFAPGAVIRPANGVTVTLSGHIHARPIQIFDYSLGGVIAFTGNKNTHEFYPEWFGAVGDNVASDSTAWQKMVAGLPNYARVKIAAGARYVFTSTVVMAGKSGVIIDSGLHAGYAESNAPSIRWAGADGGKMFAMDRCRWCQINGLQWIAGTGVAGVGADRAIVLDGYDVYDYTGANTGVGLGIGSACKVLRNEIGASRRATFKGIAVAEAIAAIGQPNNQEYHDLCHNNIDGYQVVLPDQIAGFMTVTTAAASPNVTAITGAFTGLAGQRIRIAGAGVSGRALDTTILSVTDATHAVLTINATATLVASPTILQENLGTGIFVAASANAKRIGCHDNQINNLAIGIDIAGGSAQWDRTSFYSNDINVRVGNVSEPTMEMGTNTERSRCHIQSTSGSAFLAHTAIGGRYDPQRAVDRYINHLATGGTMNFKGIALDGQVPNNSYLLLSSQAGNVILESVYFGSGGENYAKTFDPLASAPQMFGLQNELSNPEWQRHKFQTGVVVRNLAGQGAGGSIKGVGIENGDAFTGQYAGVEGAIELTSGAGFNAMVAAVLATMGKAGQRYYGQPDPIGVHIPFPIIDNGDLVHKARGIRIVPPTLTAGSRILNGTGLEIGDLANNGVEGGAKAIDQLGAKDVSAFAGPVRTAARQAGANAAAVGSGGTYTPDASLYETHRLTCAGNVTIGLPTWMGGTPPNGAELIIHIFNNTAGAITVTLNAAIKGGFIAPATVNSTSRRWQYDATSGHWWPVGAQSPDFVQ